MSQQGAFIRELEYLDCPTHGWDFFRAGTLSTDGARQVRPCPDDACGYTVETTAWYRCGSADNERLDYA